MKFLKTFLKNVGIFIGLFAILALANRWYLGGFTKLEVKEQHMGPYTMAYINFTGEYGKVWPSMTKVSEILSGVGIVSETGIGIYYDDPASVSWAELRSDIGAVITPQDSSKLINNKEIKIKTIPAKTEIVVEFPLKNTISYMIWPMKVYPVITKYMEAKWYKKTSMLELYDMADKKIYYMTDIIK